jgi:hypothetical protein
MPVIFILCKHVAKNERYVGFMNSFWSRLSRSSGGEKDCASQEFKERNKWEWSGRIRLAIPKPTISGLGSWIRRTEKNASQFNTQADSYLGLESGTDDYHRQLRAQMNA